MPEPRQEDTTARSALTRKVWVLTGLVALADFVFGATFVTFMEGRGLSASLIGLLLSGTAVVSFLMEAPSGAWGDRHGHKRLVVAGLTLWSFGLALFASAHTTGRFAAAIVLWTAGLALYSGAATSLLINTLNADACQQQGAAAVRGTETIRWIASAVGAALVALSTWTISVQASIVFSASVLAGAALWVGLSWPDSPTRDGLPVWPALRAGFRFVTTGECRMLLILTVMASADLAVIILTWQPAALTLAGMPAEWLGISLLALSLGAAAGAWATRWTANMPPVTIVCVALFGLNSSLACLWIGPAGATAAYILAELFVGVALTSLTLWGQRLFPDELRATATSVLGTASGTTIAVTHGVTGNLWQHNGLTRAVSAVALTLGLATCVCFIYHRVRQHVGISTQVENTTAPSSDAVSSALASEGTNPSSNLPKR